jgi:hypothetical protein|tara:strand:+ start:658 stop:927 length:270 start_codon:yes stop_codon:yes gene_type:complete
MSRPKLRKVDTAKRKRERKETQEELQKRTSMFLDVPEECCTCSAKFDKKSKEMADTWHVVVFEERKVIRLSCPSCWEQVQLLTEEKNAK